MDKDYLTQTCLGFVRRATRQYFSAEDKFRIVPGRPARWRGTGKWAEDARGNDKAKGLGGMRLLVAKLGQGSAADQPALRRRTTLEASRPATMFCNRSSQVRNTWTLRSIRSVRM